MTSNTISAGERVRRNVTVSGRRTSVSLEVAMWEALRELCERERLTPAELFTLVDQKRDEASLASALRIFALTYFRLLAGWRSAETAVRPVPQTHSPIFHDAVGEFERGRITNRRTR